MTLGAARVIYTINDLSAFVDQIVRGYVIFIGRFERGPIGDPKIVSSWDEFTRIYGKPIAASLDPLVAKLALLQGARLIVIRIAHYSDPSDAATLTAVQSEVTLQDRGDEPTAGYIESSAEPFTFNQALSGRVTGTEVGPYSITSGVNDAFKVRVGVSGAWGSEQTVTLTDGTRTAQQVVDDLNAGTSGLTAEVVENRVKLAANTVGDDLEIMAVANDAYSTLGFVEAVNSHVAGTDSLVVDIDENGDQTFDLEPTAGETGAFSLTAAQVAAQLATIVGATAVASQGKVRITSGTTGTDSKVQVKPASTATAALGFDTGVHAGTAGTPQNTLKFKAKDPGSFGDEIKIKVYDADLRPAEEFDIRVAYSRDGNMNEYWANLNMDPDSDRYVVTFINERSRLVQCEDLDSTNAAPGNRPALDAVGTALTGGDDGLSGLNEADWIGNENTHTGLYAIDKTAGEMALAIIIPGTTSLTVAQALANYCEMRNFIGFMMIPAGLDPEDAVDWRMGNSPYSHEAFNSYRMALYYGRPKVYDDRDGSRKHVSNLGHLASVISRTHNDYGWSYAPAGPKRGIVDFVEGLDFNVGDFPGYQDLFAEYGINYLQISRLTGIEGAMFWEQRTTQRAASSLRNLNVMFFLTYMRRVLEPVLRLFLFDANHPVTWREVKRTLAPQFRLWKEKYDIYDFVLQCDEDAYFDGGELKNAYLNSGLEIDQGIYRARALIQPTQAILYLEFEVGVTNTGESFEEFTQLKELPGWVRR